jgi:hypothetical protein
MASIIVQTHACTLCITRARPATYNARSTTCNNASIDIYAQPAFHYGTQRQVVMNKLIDLSNVCDECRRYR